MGLDNGSSIFFSIISDLGAMLWRMEAFWSRLNVGILLGLGFGFEWIQGRRGRRRHPGGENYRRKWGNGKVSIKKRERIATWLYELGSELSVLIVSCCLLFIQSIVPRLLLDASDPDVRGPPGSSPNTSEAPPLPPERLGTRLVLYSVLQKRGALNIAKHASTRRRVAQNSHEPRIFPAFVLN